MTQTLFRAIVVEETADHQFVSSIQTRAVSDLPKGDVLIKVHYSSLNYKDALSASGNKGVTRRYPHTPGIDAAGEVADSSCDDFSIGEPVLVTGHDLGMNTSGGLAEYIRVPADWVIRLPRDMTLKQSMMYGTAGLTAALSLLKLEDAGITPQSGDVLVTGASGGVGSLAVSILSAGGYSVVAASGKAEAIDFLTKLGAKEVLDRNSAIDTSGKPLLPGRFAGAIDTVGGDILSFALRSIQYGGAVTCCGNAASPKLDLTVYPFILRGISLIGIDSAECPQEIRKTIWNRLAGEWHRPGLESFMDLIPMEEVSERMDAMLKGKHKGRCVVQINP